MKPLMMQFPADCFDVLPLTSKYSPRYPVFRYDVPRCFGRYLNLDLNAMQCTCYMELKPIKNEFTAQLLMQVLCTKFYRCECGQTGISPFCVHFMHFV